MLRLCLLAGLLVVSLAAPVAEELKADDGKASGPALLRKLPEDGGSMEKPSEVDLGLEGTQTADLAFLVDVTGSMSSYIQGVKEAIDRIVQSANKKEIMLRLAFIGYRDPFTKNLPKGQNADDFWRSDDIEDSEFELLPFTERLGEFKEFMEGVAAKGGGDLPEDVFGGLEKAGALEWSPDANKRVLFHIADVPGHGSDLGGSGKHNGGDPLGRKLPELLGDLKEQDVEYVFGNVTTSTRTMMGVFSEVWGSPIKQFSVAAPRRSSFRGRIRPMGFGEFSGRAPMPSSASAGAFGPAGPPPPPMVSRRFGGRAMSRSKASFGASAGGGLEDAEESVADKVFSAVDSLFE